MAEWKDSDAISLSPQRRFRVAMQTDKGRTVSVTLTAGSIESVIDQVKGRRIATPPGLCGFSVAEIAEE